MAMAILRTPHNALPTCLNVFEHDPQQHVPTTMLCHQHMHPLPTCGHPKGFGEPKTAFSAHENLVSNAPRSCKKFGALIFEAYVFPIPPESFGLVAISSPIFILIVF